MIYLIFHPVFWLEFWRIAAEACLIADGNTK